MEASGTQSHLLPLNLLDIDSAMDLLTAFIPQNSPARLAELVSSSALDPVHTEILYGILGSPLELTSGGFIDVSNEVVLPIGEFLLRALVGCVPRDSIRVLGQRRGRWNPSCVYSRKRKAQSLWSTSVLLMSSKKRSLLALERGKEKKVEVPYSWKKQFMLLSFSNEISAKVLQANFDVASPSGSYQHLAGPGSFDCRVMGSDKTYSLQMPLQELSCHELRSISYPGEGTGANSSHISCSGIHDVKYADSTSEDISPDVEHDANLMKEQVYQCSTVIKPECRPLQDQSSSITHTLGEECNTLSLESVFTYGFHKEHAIERTNRLEPDFETLLMNQMIDQTEFHEIDYNIENVSALLDCSNSNHLIVNANDERKLYSKDAELITSLLDSKETLVDSMPGHCYKKGTSLLDYKVGSNGAATEFMLQTRSCDKPADAAKDKQRAFNPPCKKDHFASANLQNVVGPSIASNGTSSIKKPYRNAEAGLVAKQKVQNACDVKKTFKQNMVDVAVKPMKDSSEQKLMPNFESFIIEEEEGSGGYGTVYRAQRKDDGKIFAVKCPHANAHSHHVNNELKMLERFGGRNFVIKYEGSFKNGDSECFVLEHVEHDRPEILKKEIDMFELQWYGYCMFRALASLHKQGIVHRDVKPGNFLFSRQLNKGYLIDFNLASDLHQKFCRSGKRKTPSAAVNPNPLLKSKPVPIVLSRKFIDRGLLEIAKKEAANESKKAIASKSSKKKPHKGDMDGRPIAERSKHGSQTADGSGLTSTKDQTSTKTPVDWLNQPMPNKGRKELINFVRKAVNSPQNLKPLSNGPSSQRKRVAAPMTKTDARLLIFTPMPLHSAGNAVAGAGMLKNKAGGKAKREGPCVGTKGFRAPEVLFKSFHQGCKIDVWSAGVTLLYFMIGRAPFGGDPEQNIKEIAKLRGSEDLWEIAKLHNCESSFPVDLLEVESLKSMELRDWCAKNTKRPEFMELIPRSLFDLVDRCLAVNPRLRLSAEEALMHKFFAPCHESIRRQRLLRKPECRAETNGSSI